jgi:hypothetical protein
MLEDELRKETQRWLSKIKAEREKITIADTNKENFIKNIDAYISDSEHFLSAGDLIRAFEAVIWAWSQLEIGKNMGIIRNC